MSKEQKQVLQKGVKTVKEIKDFVSSLESTCDPSHVAKQFDTALVEYQNSTGKEKEKKYEQFEKIYKEAVNIVGLNNHYPVAETLTNNRTLIIEFADQLVDEYRCQTASEKSLVHMIAGAYGRVLEYSKLLNNCQRLDYLSHEKNGYYSLLSKELDRANRQYLAALMTLKQIKTPEIKVSVRANTAFIAQNQQLNNNEYENNKQ